MKRFSWWHVAIGATIVALAAVAATSFAESPFQVIGAWACLAALGLGYSLFGWQHFLARDDRRPAFSRSALVFPVFAVACTVVATAFDPSMATLQAIAFPVIWFGVEPTRRAIVLNVVLAAGVFGAFLISTGTSADAIWQALVIELISVVFSLALGLWFSFALQAGQENTRLLRQLEAVQDELALVHREGGVLSERERLAGEIHDTIAQSLTGLVMVAQRSQAKLVTDARADVTDDLHLIEDIARDALVETRALVAASAPVDASGGLLAALDRLVTRFTRETGVVITIDADRYRSEPNEVEVVLLRCAQEALANVRKHSGATRVSVTLAADHGDARLTVADDGSGIDTSQPLDAGFGLIGMQQRLALLGGSMKVGQSPTGGVQLSVTLPSATEVEA